MRKLNLAVCAVALSVISATSYAATGGTVTFNGKLIAETCQVDTDSENIIAYSGHSVFGRCWRSRG